LLDLSMPEVSGFDVAATVRQLEQENGLPRTYIAALTGLVSDKDRAAAFAAGVDEYVTKPATLKDVQGVVANWRAVADAPP
jgi:CheY-like chemotaxis protein